MFLSPGRGFLFLHVPKTGGTALTLALETRALKDDIIVGDTPKARARANRQRRLTCRGRLWKHSTYADLDGILPVPQMERLFALTLVRNPWDRVASLYHWLRVQDFVHPLVATARARSFADFLATPVTQVALAANGYETYLRQPDGAPRAALHVRIEHFATDIAPFEAHLGRALPPLARFNESERPRDWRGLYSDDNAALVATLCAPDIARFGYTFDPPYPISI